MVWEDSPEVSKSLKFHGSCANNPSFYVDRKPSWPCSLKHGDCCVGGCENADWKFPCEICPRIQVYLGPRKSHGTTR